MRPLVVTEFISVDGVVDSPGGGEHPHAGWTFNGIEFVEEAYDIKARETETASALLFGRVTHDEFAPLWPQMEEFAAYNAMPKYVVSSTMASSAWNNTSVLRSIDDVAALKQTEGGEIHVHGSARLAQGLAAAGLVDRYHLLVFPVLLGSGKRLFSDVDTLQHLTLTQSASYRNGVQLAVYQVKREG